MSAQSYVAKYLAENGYLETLRAFEAECGNLISKDVPVDESLEDVIADRLRYLSITEKASSLFDWVLDPALQTIKDTQLKPWLAPYPRAKTAVGPVGELVVDSALLELNGRNYALLATSGRALVVIDLLSGACVGRNEKVLGNVVVRTLAVAGNTILLCGMDGKVRAGTLGEQYEFVSRSETQIHPRLVTEIKVVEWRLEFYLVSMGWDFFVKVFSVKNGILAAVGSPCKLAHQGTSMDAVVYEDKLYVAVGKKDITLMDVVAMEFGGDLQVEYQIALNDAEFSAAGFTPTCVRLFYNGTGVPLVAVATSHEPYMRLVLVSLKNVGLAEHKILRNQILANINTFSPQDKFSAADIGWRADGSGLWIAGEDGVIRGLDVALEKVVVELTGHDGRIKLVCYGADVLVSCGTDREVYRWS